MYGTFNKLEGLRQRSTCFTSNNKKSICILLMFYFIIVYYLREVSCTTSYLLFTCYLIGPGHNYLFLLFLISNSERFTVHKSNSWTTISFPLKKVFELSSNVFIKRWIKDIVKKLFSSIMGNYHSLVSFLSLPSPNIFVYSV